MFAWIVLATVFGFTDLEISKAVVDRQSFFGIFGARYGQLPGFGLIVISFVILVGSLMDDIKKQKMIGDSELEITYINNEGYIVRSNEKKIIIDGLLSFSMSEENKNMMKIV